MSNRKKTSHKNVSHTRPVVSGRSALALSVPAGVAIIVAAVFMAYFPAINGGFVLDDDHLLTKNELIKASDGLYRMWFTTNAPDYWPMTYSTFWIEWRLWGMNSTGYHVTNILLHVVESLLIWLILRKLCIPGAFLAALIFAVHPVNVESVAWISQRKNTMAMLFFLLSILWYLKSEVKTPGTSAGAKHINTTSRTILFWYWMSLAAFVLAMLSKGSAVVLPVVLLGIVWRVREAEGDSPIFSSRKLGQSPWRDMAWIAPFFAVAAALAFVNVWFQTHGTGEAIRNAGFTERLLGAGGVVWFYLYKAILPVDLSFIYPQWDIVIRNPLWWLPLLACVVVTVLLWLNRKTWSRPYLFAWGFFCTALVPAMGFVDVGFMYYSLVADHYQHIAIIGVVALASAGFCQWRDRLRESARLAATIIAIAAVGALLFLSWRQSGLYRNEIALYQNTLEKNPKSWMMHNSLGKALFAGGLLQDAIGHYRQALAIKPDYADAYNNIGAALLQTDRAQDADEFFRQALRLKPEYPDALNNMGIVSANSGRLQEAIGYYEKALSQEPRHTDAHNNLGIALAKTGRVGEAVEQYRMALQIDPYFPEVYHNLAVAYASLRQSAEAAAMSQKAVELARSQGHAELAEQFEDWLKAYRVEIKK